MYEDFALVYDELMDDVPYEKWADMLYEEILKYGVSRPEERTDDPLVSEKNLVLDLACGTGTLTELMYKKGFDMIGVDLSQDMLNIAVEKRDESGSDILYLNQDMRELDLYSTVGTVYCLCDSINYLINDEDVAKTFKRVFDFLYPGGLFIFDFNTHHKYKNVIGTRTIAEDREDVSFIWENSYDTESGINEYNLTIFIKNSYFSDFYHESEGETDTSDRESNILKDLYRKHSETHLQRGYSFADMRTFIETAGFLIVDAFDMDAGKRREPDDVSERIFIVAKRM